MRTRLYIEALLEAQGAEIDVLRVNHHGANNTSEIEYLRLIEPELAIISAGNVNTHGHPRRGNFRRLTDAGVQRILLTNYGTTTWSRRNDVKPRLAIAQSHIVLTTDGTSYTTHVSESFETDE